MFLKGNLLTFYRNGLVHTPSFIRDRPSNYKIRRDSDLEILKGQVHARRLKLYHSPDDRPHYFLPEYQDVVLNPEELDDQNIAEILPPNAEQHQANAD